MKWNSLLLLLLLFVVDGVWWLCGYERKEKNFPEIQSLQTFIYQLLFLCLTKIKMERKKTPRKKSKDIFFQAGNFPEKKWWSPKFIEWIFMAKKKIHSQLIFVARMKRKKKIKIQVSKQNVKKCENETGNKIWHLWKCFWLWIWYIPTNKHKHTHWMCHNKLNEMKFFFLSKCDTFFGVKISLPDIICRRHNNHNNNDSPYTQVWLWFVKWMSK